MSALNPDQFQDWLQNPTYLHAAAKAEKTDYYPWHWVGTPRANRPTAETKLVMFAKTRYNPSKHDPSTQN